MKKTLSYILGLALLVSMSIPAFAAGEFITALDVSNVKTTAYKGAVKIQWDAVDAANLEGYEVWWDTEPVTTDGDSYQFRQDTGNVTSYVVTGLTNGTKYYFAVTAYDSNDNESKNWSTPKDASATPSANASEYADEESPKVAKAEAVDNVTVKVVFSEEVVLPEEDAEEEFVIENDDTFEPLEVLKAELDKEDLTKKTVLLTTAAQEEGASYTLTVQTGIEDKAGNIVISGTSDTAIFEGSGEEAGLGSAVSSLKIDNVEVVDATHILVNFSTGVVLSTIAPEDNFEIVVEGAETNVLDIVSVQLGANTKQVADASALIETDSQEQINYILRVKNVTDKSGTVLTGDDAEISFKGLIPADADEEDEEFVAEDVASLIAKKMLDGEKYLVDLSWKIPTGNVGHIVSQILYMSDDKGEKYSREAGLEADVEKYSVEDLEAGEYWFKLTQQDEDGNETEGSIVKVVLAETGPGVIGLVLGSAFLGRVVTRRRRKNGLQ